MRRIAIVNQKGGVGKTTTAVNLGAALARAGRRVVLVDLDPQGNLSTHLDVEVPVDMPSTYGVLCDGLPFGEGLLPTSTPNLRVLPTNIDLSGAEMELAAALGRESILNDSVEAWMVDNRSAVDYLIFDCPPSLGLLSVNGLVAAREVFIALQTEFFALQGMSKLVEIVQLLKRRLNPELEISGIIPCLYDSRLRLAREVLGEIRRYFPGPVFQRSIRSNVKLAEAPSYGQTIFEYAPESAGAGDYAELALEVIAQETEPLGLAPTAEPVVESTAIEATAESVVESAPTPEPVVELTPVDARADPGRDPVRATDERERASAPDTDDDSSAPPQASSEVGHATEVAQAEAPGAAPTSSPTPTAPQPPSSASARPVHEARPSVRRHEPPRASDLPALPADAFRVAKS